VETVNEAQKLRLVAKVCARLGDDLRGKRIALWGLAFKPETDDMRDAPSRVLISELTARGARICAYDPIAMTEARRIYASQPSVEFADDPMTALNGADALVIVTEWKEFRSPDFASIRSRLKRPLVFDGRNLYDPKAIQSVGMEYFAMGRSPMDAEPKGTQTAVPVAHASASQPLDECADSSVQEASGGGTS
jgi:UDPglucose 6-dehydrogenase